MNYIAVIHHDPGSAFGVSFPDFPGCITAGRTLEEAKVRAVEVLHLCIEEMRAAGEAIPEPATFEVVMSNPDFSDGVAFVVSVTPVRSAAE